MARTAQHLIEVLTAPTVNARAAQYVIEALVARPTASPTTITGAGVSQMLVEALISQSGPAARVAQAVVEVLCTPVYVTPGGGAPAAVTRGWVVIA